MALTDIDGGRLADNAFSLGKNLIVNGAMQVAQRGTTSTSSDRRTVDSFYFNFGGGIAGTQSQQTLSSGDPYNLGFRNFYRFAISTPSTAAGTYCQVITGLEAQNVANSGWQYASAASSVTVSFWVRSSVAQTFYGQLVSKDGTSQNYIFSFALSADTWTKVTKTVPGNSSVTIDNDNGRGLELVIVPFFGTDLTDSGATVDAWQAYSGSSRVPDMTSTWANTNGATFDVTGVQLEVGTAATPFEHRSYGDELARCQRYYCLIANGTNKAIGTGGAYTAGNSWAFVHLPVEMRAAPSLDYVSGTDYYMMIGNNSSDGFNDLILEGQTTSRMARVSAQANISLTQGYAYFMQTDNASAKVGFSAEL